MQSARERFEELFTHVHHQVRKGHPSLSNLAVHLLRREVDEWGGQVGFSNPLWPMKYATWPTGIYLWGISLDELTSPNPPTPSIHIWLGSTRADKRIEPLRRRLSAELPQARRKRRIQWNEQDETDSRVCLWYALPEGSAGLLKKLCSDERSFVDCLVEHVTLMASFSQVLDSVLLKSNKNRP